MDVFPLEPIGLFIRGEKMTSETGGRICFWSQHQLVCAFYSGCNILRHNQFNSVDRPLVYCTLHNLSCLFQVWAAKHILGIAGTMLFFSHQDKCSTLCPSCHGCSETCKHITCCPEKGRTQVFDQSMAEIEQWLIKNNKNLDLVSLLL